MNFLMILIVAILFAISLQTSAAAGATCTTSSCHTNIKEYTNLHPPVDGDDCGACHIDEKAVKGEKKHTFSWAEGDKGFKICLSCHDEMTAKTQADNAHPPVAEDCLACHNPHGGPGKGILKKEKLGEICQDCHDDKVPEVFDHGGNEANTCIACHDVKGTTGNYLLKSPEICTTSCHKVNVHTYAKTHLGRTAPEAAMQTYATQLKADGKPMAPFAPMLTCPTCHRGHPQKKEQANTQTREGTGARFSAINDERAAVAGKSWKLIEGGNSHNTLRPGSAKALCKACHGAGGPFTQAK